MLITASFDSDREVSLWVENFRWEKIKAIKAKGEMCGRDQI